MADELGASNDGEGLPLEVWVQGMGGYKLAVGYAALLWPKFETVDNYILREGCKKEIIEAFEKQPGFTPQGVEAALNHWHLADLHYTDDDLTADKLMFLGEIVREMWTAKLKIQFPDRPCTVDFNIPDDPSDLMDFQITFWQNAWDPTQKE